MITPAISVLSAVEGLGLAAPALEPLVVPITVVILVALFRVQRHGTARIARIFGPAMLVWFLMIAAMGLPWIVRYPQVLAALDPAPRRRAFRPLPRQGVFPAGGRCAVRDRDRGALRRHGPFRRGPIRLAWYAVVFPALLLNYFGQGASSFRNGQSWRRTPRAPRRRSSSSSRWFRRCCSTRCWYSTLATIIASQALISGAFSLAEQAVQLGYAPRLTVIHTSGEMAGQIYVPLVNWALVACVLLVVDFKNSSNPGGRLRHCGHRHHAYHLAAVCPGDARCWGWPGRHAAPCWRCC